MFPHRPGNRAGDPGSGSSQGSFWRGEADIWGGSSPAPGCQQTPAWRERSAGGLSAPQRHADRSAPQSLPPATQIAPRASWPSLLGRQSHARRRPGARIPLRAALSAPQSVPGAGRPIACPSRAESSCANLAGSPGQVGATPQTHRRPPASAPFGPARNSAPTHRAGALRSAPELVCQNARSSLPLPQRPLEGRRAARTPLLAHRSRRARQRAPGRSLRGDPLLARTVRRNSARGAHKGAPAARTSAPQRKG